MNRDGCLVRWPLCLTLIVVWCTAAASLAVPGGDQLQRAAQQMSESPSDDSAAFAIRSVTLAYRDMQVLLDTGIMIPFEPVRVDSTDLRYGAIFIGHGRLRFRPPIAMERQQLHRFLKSDSLDRSFGSLLLFFDTTTYRGLTAKGTAKATVPGDARRIRNSLLKYLGEERTGFFIHRALLHLTQPTGQPYLMALGDITNSDVLLLTSDPFDREQVGLYQRQMEVVHRYVFQPICSYALEASDERGEYNGTDRTVLDVLHYDITARIDHGGKLTAATKVDFTVLRQPTRIIDFFLDPEMKVDSVHDAAGHAVPFDRRKDEDRYYGLWLLPDHLMGTGDSGSFTFYYSGDVAGMELGEYYVFAGATWYPRHSLEQLRATYHMQLRSPANYTLIATGKLRDSTTHKDTLVTTWDVSQPTRNVSFNIGFFKEYQFDGVGEVPTRVFFSEDVHRWITSVQGVDLRSTARHMERQVAKDIQQSLKLYSGYFGPCPFDTIVVSEILQFASEAYPGFVHLSFDSWITTDDFGYYRLLRAHEAAHQWWGVDVLTETYRDKWLAEGFAEYSAMMYLQHVAGTQQFLDRLEESRKIILASRKTAGAVGLGVRVSNTKDKGSYQAIIYRKGAYVLHMLRYLLMDWQTMSDDRFLALMKEYHQRFHGGYASTRDFALLANTYADEDLRWFFDQWVYNNYVPTYDCAYNLKSNPQGGVTAGLHIRQKDVPPSFRMYLPIEIEYPDGHKEYQRFLVDKPVIEQELTLARAPKKIRFNPFGAVLAKVNQ